MVLPRSLTEPSAAIAALLIERGETVSVAESSAGGLIAASLLSVPGASAYFLGGAVIYTRVATLALLAPKLEPPSGVRGATATFARYLASAARTTFGSTWAVAETGATGPTGNPYGDPAGHAWVAVAGPLDVLVARHVLTGGDDREDNMEAFAVTALKHLLDHLELPDGG